MTASAVSHQVKTLEQFLGLELFRRNKRKVELTPMGEQYLVSIKYALDEIEVATKRLTANPETDIVTISVAPNFLTRWLMPRIDFNKSNTDMAIYFGHGDWHDIEVHFLRKVLLVPVCSPGLIKSGKQLAKPEDLRKHTLIQVSKRLYEWQEWLQLAGVEHSGFGRGLQLSSSQLATAAAQEGLGVALADSTLTSREIKDGKLIMPFDIMLNTHKSFYLVHKKNRSLTYGMRAFKDWVIEEMHKSSV